MEVLNLIERNCHVVKAKNRFDIPTVSGHREFVYHIRVEVESDVPVYIVVSLQLCENDPPSRTRPCSPSFSESVQYSLGR